MPAHPTTAAPLHRPGSAGFRRLNAAMVMAGLAAFGLLYGTQALLPALSDDFGVTPSGASLTVSAATGALALGVVPGTALATRWGRVAMMRGCLAAASLLTVLAALAPSYSALVVLRGLTGLVLAGVVATAMGHVGAEVDRRGLGTAMGLYVAGNSLGGVSGRVLTAAVSDVAGWRWALAVLAVGAVLASLAFWRLLPAPRSSTAGPGASDPRAALRALRNPALVALVTLPFVLMGGFVAVYNYLGYRLLADPFDLSPAVAGLVFLSYLAGSASSAVAGRLADRFGRLPVLLTAITVMGVGLAATLPDRLVTVVGGVVVLTAGFFAAHAVASGWAPVVGGGYGGQASALYVFAYYAGSSVFGSAVGVAWHEGGWGATAGAVGALVGAGLVAAVAVPVLLRRRAPGPAGPPT